MMSFVMRTYFPPSSAHPAAQPAVRPAVRPAPGEGQSALIKDSTSPLVDSLFHTGPRPAGPPISGTGVSATHGSVWATE